jgi:hypothetical protein
MKTFEQRCHILRDEIAKLDEDYTTRALTVIAKASTVGMDISVLSYSHNFKITYTDAYNDTINLIFPATLSNLHSSRLEVLSPANEDELLRASNTLYDAKRSLNDAAFEVDEYAELQMEVKARQSRKAHLIASLSDEDLKLLRS